MGVGPSSGPGIGSRDVDGPSGQPVGGLPRVVERLVIKPAAALAISSGLSSTSTVIFGILVSSVRFFLLFPRTIGGSGNNDNWRMVDKTSADPHRTGTI